jgi:hypothetical protein
VFWLALVAFKRKSRRGVSTLAELQQHTSQLKLDVKKLSNAPAKYATAIG